MATVEFEEAPMEPGDDGRIGALERRRAELQRLVYGRSGPDAEQVGELVETERELATLRGTTALGDAQVAQVVEPASSRSPIGFAGATGSEASGAETFGSEASGSEASDLDPSAPARRASRAARLAALGGIAATVVVVVAVVASFRPGEAHVPLAGAAVLDRPAAAADALPADGTLAGIDRPWSQAELASARSIGTAAGHQAWILRDDDGRLCMLDVPPTAEAELDCASEEAFAQSGFAFVFGFDVLTPAGMPVEDATPLIVRFGAASAQVEAAIEEPRGLEVLERPRTDADALPASGRERVISGTNVGWGTLQQESARFIGTVAGHRAWVLRDRPGDICFLDVPHTASGPPDYRLECVTEAAFLAGDGFLHEYPFGNDVRLVIRFGPASTGLENLIVYQTE